MKFRQKFALGIAMLTAVLSLIIFLGGPDQVMTGYSGTNGVENITYVPKNVAVLQMLFVPVLCGMAWNWVANWNDRKIAAEPELSSHRLRRAVINFVFFLWMTLPGGFAVANIILWLL